MKYRIIQILFFLGLIGVGALGLYISTAYLWWWLPIFLIYFGIISWGSSNIRSGLFLKTYSGFKQPTKQLVLTFDDGPHPNTLPILQVLREFNTKATFFCIGKNVEEYPEILQRILGEGHTCGNHTYSHPVKWGWLKTELVLDEIKKGNEALEKITGKKNQLFRPPFGVTNPRIAKALKKTKLKVIGWDLRSLDTAITDEEQLYKRVIKKIEHSSIVLFHDTQPHTANVLPRVLEYCREHGIKIVSLPEIFKSY